MPEESQIADVRRKLEELNCLEARARQLGNADADRPALVESLRAKIPRGVLALHDRLQSRGKQSVAVVRNGVCSGCHMNLPTGALIEIKRESALVRCDFCGRFVFPSREESAPVAKKQSNSRRGKNQKAR